MPDSTPTPGVTVIVTCYNHQAYVEQCLDSVLAQSLPATRVIVTDDASTDDSASVIEHWLGRHDPGWTFTRHERNSGVCATLNEALESITTEYYIHISADDWFFPDRIARQRDVASTHAVAGFVVGDILEVDAGGSTLACHDIGIRLEGLTGETHREAFFERLLAENIIPAPGVMVRTSAAREVGGYDPTLSFEDYDLWLRLADRFPVAYGAGEVSAYRVLRTSMSRSPQRVRSFRESEMAMLRKHLGKGRARDEIIRRRVAALAAQLERDLKDVRRAAKAEGRR